MEACVFVTGARFNNSKSDAISHLLQRNANGFSGETRLQLTK